MPKKNFQASLSLGEPLGDYVNLLLGLGGEEELEFQEVLRKRGMPLISLPAVDARHLQVLIASCGAEKIVEFGTLGGYSAIKMAQAVTKCGRIPKLFTFELCDKHAQVAREQIEAAGCGDWITVIQGEALQEVANIQGFAPFDFVFIDADKLNYSHYFDWAAANLRRGGMIVADNTFAWGGVADPMAIANKKGKDLALAIADYNKKAANHESFLTTLLPTGEGLTVSVKIK